MTDTEKLRLIGQMYSDVLEFTSYENDAKDALLVCIDAVIAFGEECEDGEEEHVCTARCSCRE